MTLKERLQTISFEEIAMFPFDMILDDKEEPSKQ